MEKSPPSGARAVNAFLARVQEPHRAALETLRRTLRRVLPHAAECLKYAMPCFAVQGKGVAAFAAFRDHCSYFPMSGSVLQKIAGLPRGYAASKGTLQFPIDRPPAPALVRKLVRLRLAEIADVRNGKRMDFYPDGALKAVGAMKNGKLNGAWRWYRQDGSLMRTGRFRLGEQVGDWTTWTRDGRLVKTTSF